MSLTQTSELNDLTIADGIYVNGSWESENLSLRVDNPATGEVLGHVEDATPEVALRALDASVEAFSEWSKWTPRARASLFRKAYGLLEQRAELFAQTMVRESGKPLEEARSEVSLSLEFFMWYTEQIAHLRGNFQQGSHGGYRVIDTWQPVGPSLLIVPWNFPLLMVARKAGAALAAGCSIILKSAKETPYTAALFVQTLADAGFPAGVVNLIHTSNAGGISESLMRDQRLRKISFTGSTPVGSTLIKQSAENIINVSLELGGDGPFVVLNDADIDLAVEHAIACKFRNAGQACVTANRIILQDGIADEFERKFIAQAVKLSVGDGMDEGNQVGPMITFKQRDNAAKLVEELVELGGEVLLGGQSLDLPGSFFAPTVVRLPNVRHRLYNEELFAPIATLYRVESAQEALEAANDTHYGLAAYLFTEDMSRAMHYSEMLEFGMVAINRGIMADPAAPFGGTKSSGIGREGGHNGIYEFMEQKYIALTVNN